MIQVTQTGNNRIAISLELDFACTSIRSIISCFPPSQCETHENVPLCQRAEPRAQCCVWSSVPLMCLCSVQVRSLGRLKRERSMSENATHHNGQLARNDSM